MQPTVTPVDHLLVYHSLYEICYSFLILLGTALYYEKTQMSDVNKPRSFDIGTACRHITQVLTYNNHYTNNQFTFAANSAKYNDVANVGKGVNLINK